MAASYGRRALGEGIGSLGREELISLARAVCGQAAAFAGGHLNIHPENIFMSTDGSPWLGGRAEHAPGEWTTDELEYMAPELFWSGTGDARSDVYSIGLLLYAGVTCGRLPFFPKPAKDMTNELRAGALRRRMNGEQVPIPTIAGEKLGAVLKKALAFDADRRYKDTVELSMALEASVGEGDAAAMAMFGKPERELSAVERTMAGILASYSNTDAPEPELNSWPAPELNAEPAPEPETDRAAHEPTTADIFGTDEKPITPEDFTWPPDSAWTLDDEPERAPEPEPQPAGGEPGPEPAAAAPDAEPAPAEAEEPPTGQQEAGEAQEAEDSEKSAPAASAAPPEPPRRPVQPASGGAEQRPPRRENGRSTLIFTAVVCCLVAAAALAMHFIVPLLYSEEPTVIPTPSGPVETVAQTAAPTPTLTPSAPPSDTPAPTQTAAPQSRYEIISGDLSWTEAEQRCRELGGHLAVVDDEADFARLTAAADAQGLDFLWIGFFRVNGEIQWVDGSAGWFNWAPGEPSRTDTDGTAENFGLLWRTDSGWVYNDSRNDPAAAYPSVYSGHMGFVCEYDA